MDRAYVQRMCSGPDPAARKATGEQKADATADATSVPLLAASRAAQHDGGTAMMTSQEFYDRAKKNPTAIVMDVGEVDPVIIFEQRMDFTRTDGSQVTKTVYVTFEYVKKHLKEIERCDCETCRGTIAAYRINKKARAGATPEEVEALGWTRMWEH
jgi:hypothetical protein